VQGKTEAALVNHQSRFFMVNDWSTLRTRLSRLPELANQVEQRAQTEIAVKLQSLMLGRHASGELGLRNAAFPQFAEPSSMSSRPR
jgi:hypothetical protein